MATTAWVHRGAARAMTEAELRENVRELARVWGWLLQFTWNSRHSPSGWPDLVLAHPRSGRVLFRELKRHGRHPTAAQRQWLDVLTCCGLDAGVWRPDDWLSGRIRRDMTPTR